MNIFERRKRVIEEAKRIGYTVKNEENLGRGIILVGSTFRDEDLATLEKVAKQRLEWSVPHQKTAPESKFSL